MKKILGARCPDCGTTDAPVYLPDRESDTAGCPRCGRIELGDTWEDALSAFYGQQDGVYHAQINKLIDLPSAPMEAVQDEPDGPDLCACGGKRIGIRGPTPEKLWWVRCVDCETRTPAMRTAYDAIRVWNAMQRAAKEES